ILAKTRLPSSPCTGIKIHMCRTNRLSACMRPWIAPACKTSWLLCREVGMARLLLLLGLLNRISRRTRQYFIFWKEWECSTGRPIKGARDRSELAIGNHEELPASLMGSRELNHCTAACVLIELALPGECSVER